MTISDEDFWPGKSSGYAEPFINRQDVGNVLHRAFVAGDQFAIVDERAAFVPFAKMQQSREIVTFLPAWAVSPPSPGVHLF